MTREFPAVMLSDTLSQQKRALGASIASERSLALSRSSPALEAVLGSVTLGVGQEEVDVCSRAVVAAEGAVTRGRQLVGARLTKSVPKAEPMAHLLVAPVNPVTVLLRYHLSPAAVQFTRGCRLNQGPPQRMSKS